jgi:hypothetical protein
MYGNIQRMDVDTTLFESLYSLPVIREHDKFLIMPTRRIKRFVYTNHRKIGFDRSSMYTYLLLHGLKGCELENPTLEAQINSTRGLMDTMLDNRLRLLNYWMSVNATACTIRVPDEKPKNELRYIRVHDYRGNYLRTARLPVEEHGLFKCVVYAGERYTMNVSQANGVPGVSGTAYIKLRRDENA